MPVSKRRRFEVFKRDKYTCQYCGKRPPDTILHCDHILPSSKGGSDEIDNLTTSCIDCNQGKSDVLLGEVMPALDEDQRLEAIQEMAERRILIERQMEEGIELRAVESSVALTIANWIEETLDVQIYDSQFKSLEHFAQKLTPNQMKDAIYATRGGRAYGGKVQWLYFCKCCWMMIKGEWEGDKRQADAAAEVALAAPMLEEV